MEKLTWRFNFNGKCLQLFSGTLCRIFQCYHLVNIDVFCNANSLETFCFWLCIKTLSGRGGVSKQKIWTFFILMDEHSLQGHKSIYDHRNIKAKATEEETWDRVTEYSERHFI